MENQIVCPKCKKSFSNTSIINEAAKGEGSYMQSMVCDCGERITYWQIAALLRNQKSIGGRFQKWVRSLSHSHV